MAKKILPKNSFKLNLTPQQISLFQKIILTGNQMVELLSAQLEFSLTQSARIKEANKLIKRWSNLMVQLAKMLI
jgi:hypothetical protein